MVFCCCIRKFR